jgi:uncharacterized protein YgbK (DUF1537 family)
VNETHLNLQETLSKLPPEWPVDPRPEIQAIIISRRQKLIVLDDDPTGSQLVYHIPVLTEWSTANLLDELENDIPAFFILTNSRSLQAADAVAVNEQIGRNLLAVAHATHRSFAVVSRGDSTLRGHFPGEMDALARGLATDFDAWLLIPALPEAGRYTINDVHYVAEGDWLIPTGESVYARDATFGYRSSNLRDWVAEKSAGRIARSDVASLTLEDIRLGGPQKIQQQLLSLKQGSVCIVNSASRRDLDVVALGILMAEASKRRYLYRCGPSFVPARIGLNPREPLQSFEIALPAQGAGLIIVGSYVPKTTRQMGELLEHGDVESVEVEVERLLDPTSSASEVRRAAIAVEERLRSGRDTVLYTSRRLVTGMEAASSLAIGQKVSDHLIKIIQSIQIRPRYVLAKGGITSSDVATKGLGVKRAMVIGQVLPGVSLWELGAESRFPGMAYLVFPGNVGGPEALLHVVRKLRVS